MSQDELDPLGSKKITPESLAVPEKIIDQGIRAMLDYWRTVIPSEKITPRMRALDGSSDVDASVSNEAEVNALAGHFMRPVWIATRDWMHAHPDESAQRNTNDPLSLKIISASAIREKFAHNAREGFATLYDGSCTIFGHHALQLELAQEKTISDNEKGASAQALPDETKNFLRYRSLLEANPFYLAISQGMPSHHIYGGFLTSQRITWGFLQRLADFYNDASLGPPSSEKMEKLIEAGREFASTLAKTEFGVLATIEDEITDYSSIRHELNLIQVPLLKNIYVRKKDKKFIIDIERDTLLRISQNFSEIVERNNFVKGRPFHTSCPAALISTTRGKSGLKKEMGGRN